jgi:hypothetical protein
MYDVRNNGEINMENSRTITIIKESDHKSRFSTNHCQITRNGKVSTIHLTDERLKIELLKNKLIASGADEELVDEFQELVSNYSYQDGIDTAIYNFL